MKKVTLELTDEQLRVLELALDSFSRLGIGQLKNAVEGLTTNKQHSKNLRALEAAEQIFKIAMFPNEDLPLNASMSICNLDVSENAKIARDLHHTLKHMQCDPNHPWSVFADNGFQTSKEPTPKIKIEDIDRK